MPKVKARAKVVLLIDSIGPLNPVSWTFPYGSRKQATVSVPLKLPDGAINNPMYPAGNPVNRWTVGFWTDAGLEVCPTGTVVQMQLSGSEAAGYTVKRTAIR